MTNNQAKTINTLAEVFQICQSNSKAPTPAAFLKESGLSKLLTGADLQRLADGRACFPKETVMAIYGLLPLKFRFNGIEINLLPQAFYRLNYRAAKQDEVAFINISLRQAEAVYQEKTVAKLKYIKENINRLRYENQKAKNPEQLKASYQRYFANLSPEKKALYLEKKKLYTRQRRAEHPEIIKESNQKAKERYAQLPEIEQLKLRINSRLSNKKYRETHKEVIAERNKRYRQSLDPEIVRQKRKAYRATGKCKQNDKKYYEKHKQEILAKAKANPKTKITQRRYKIRKRFREKTGSKVLALLQALINAKSK